MIKILGMCAIDSEENYLGILKQLYNKLGNNFIYKGSFDKANRSSILGKRGVGIDEAIKIFKKAKELYPDVKLTTDIHECWQAEMLTELIDIIQIPAFLCRQTDLIVEASKHFKVVNIKKGQWLSAENMIHAIDKVKNTDADTEAWITERGTSFGYTRLIVDFRDVDILSKNFDKVIFDVTHSTQYQLPNGKTSGDKELAQKYIKVASIFGYDGIFAETHFTHEQSISDSHCIIPLNNLLNLV